MISNTLTSSLKLSYGNFSYSMEFIDVFSTWCSELLKNVRDHGGERSLFALRFGDWTIRKGYYSVDPLNVIQKGVCYDSKYLYFNKIKDKNTTKFLDIHLVDSGEGFIKLKDACVSDKIVLEKKCNNIRYLHRYAMLSHSTSKVIASSEIAPIHLTGLGLISQQAISKDAYISIKDRNVMTYFTKEKLGHVSSEGDNDASSKYDISGTMLNCIIPFEDIKWKNHNIYKMDYVDSDFVNFLYINDLTTHKFEEINSYEYDIVKKTHVKSDMSKTYDIAIIDLSRLEKSFDKPTALRTINIVYYLLNKNTPVVLYGANVPEMRVIQDIITEDKEKSIFPVEKNPKVTKLFCPILSPSYEIFLCGNLSLTERNSILNAFRDNKVTTLSEALMKLWPKCKDLPLPIRKIDRIINYFHGQSFHDDIINNNYVEEAVSDMHSNVLDSYYEVSSYLRRPEVQLKWRNDLIRIIGRHKINTVVVDSVESKMLVQSALDYYCESGISVHRFNKRKIEQIESKGKETKALLILSCAYSGSELRSVPDISVENNISISFVYTLLDLTSYSKSYIQKNWTKCEYDFFAKGKRPKKLDDKNLIPQYIANSKGRLVHFKYLDKNTEDIFQAIITKSLLYDFLGQIGNVYVGHSVEHDHHHDVFIDVRSSLREIDKLSHYFNILICNNLNSDSYNIIYSEDSELYPVINMLKYPPGYKQKIEFIPVRQVSDDKYSWANLHQSVDITGKNIVVIDEGAYTCNTLVGIIRLLVEYKPLRIDVIVVEKRLTPISSIDKLQKLKWYHEKRDIKINYHCVIDVKAPVWDKYDCPYCKLKLKEKKTKPLYYDKRIMFGEMTITNEATAVPR
jgi:hypothetical protein